ncbi:Meiotic nuclear division protein 1 [Coemansia javaensis]|uniref:Meiotic nuclear division protein 1 n=1 Tax=Coemansia javaensis TaxID=2761396 RepID=A0A9W8H7S9_9FUNG|nr:Meiotic nuclear division protein 1 [Coemansia javaensis]
MAAARFPYRRGQTILLVGEGNFSFARSVAEQLGAAGGVVATAYDARETAGEKYPDLDAHVAAVERLGGTVLFGVDGTQLARHKRLRARRFSRIVFNFPHVGLGIKDQDRNVRANQELLLGFFRSARPLLAAGRPAPPPAQDPPDSSDSDGARPGKRRRRRRHRSHGPTAGVLVFEGVEAQVVYDADSAGSEDDEPQPDEAPGQIHVALKSGPPYDSWAIRRLAAECGLATHATLPFSPAAFPGYEHRRTLGYKEGVSSDANKEISDKRPRGPRLGLDEKRKRMMDIFHEAPEPYLLKELERIGPKQKGIVAQSVKDVVQSLVDDGMCHCEKIGSSNFFWAFPSEAAVRRRNRRAALEKELAQQQAAREELAASIARAQLGREQTDERAVLAEELAAAEAAWKQQQAELQQFKECDPVVLGRKRDDARHARDAANRWTDNIFIFQSWIREKFNMDLDEFNKHMGIPADLDSV